MMVEEQLFDEIREDHEAIQQIIERLVQTSSRSAKSRENYFEKLKEELLPHMKAEEKSLYPALVKEKSARELALAALEEHHVAEILLKELDKMAKDEEQWKAKLLVFKELARLHIESEESVIFDKAKALFNEQRLEDIFEDFQRNKELLLGRLRKRMAA